MKRAARVGLLLAIALAAAAAGYLLSAASRAPAVDVETLLATSLPDVDGTRRRVGEWPGRVLVINFWATWCGPCLEEIPSFVEMQSRFASEGVQFIGIAIDEQARVKDYAKTARINYPLLVGQSGAIELSRLAGNQRGGLPYTVVLSGRGKVLGRFEGIVPRDALERLVSPARG